MSKNTVFHLWIPDIFSVKGGTQTYSAFFLKAIQNILPNSHYQVFIKNDPSLPTNHPFLPHTKFHCFGNYSSIQRTFKFSYEIFINALLNRPNLIISTHINFTIIAYLLHKITGVKYWCVAHGIEAWNLTNPLLKQALLHAEKILAVSGYTRDRLLQEQSINPDKISILPNTFDSDKFKIDIKPSYLLERYKLTEEKKIILTVARLSNQEQYKGYDKIINALPQIRQIIPNIHYILVGKGDDQPRIEKLISDLELQENITLTGFIPDSELCDHYNLCDIFAMPSKGEGFGIVYLEALACGKPTLAGNQDGSIDALCHGELGALINPDNVDSIAKTIIDILQYQYDNELIYQPENLRQKVIDIYGFNSFQNTLAQYFHPSS